MLDSRISEFSCQFEKIGAESRAQITAQTEAIKSSLGSIFEISSAQTALLNKMNTSSDKMAGDIKNMRRIANYTYYEKIKESLGYVPRLKIA